MKKLFLIVFSLFLALGIVACGGNSTNPTETMTLAEQLDMPVNLTIDDTNKSLSWDAVEHADAYNVYVDGVFEAEVSETSFDFSDIEGDRIVFTVKAISDAGYRDSNMSTTLAYLANRETVVAELKLSMSTYNMDVQDPDAFANELANKGMTADDLETMMTSVQNLENASNMNDVSDIYGVFDTSMDNMDIEMIEALVSSIIKTELPVMIQEQLDYMNAVNGTCRYEDHYTSECYYYYNYDNDIDQMEALLDFIENNDEEAVRSIMILVEYFMTVQDGIDQELIANIETMSEAETPSDMNAALLVSVKNDLVNNFKDNLPSLDDFILMNSTLMALSGIVAEDAVDMSIIPVAKQSATSRMSIELFFNFLLAMDEDYIQVYLDMMTNDSMENGKALIIENIAFLDAFIDNNQTLISEMNNVLTEEEQELMFTEYQVMNLMTTYNQALAWSDQEKDPNAATEIRNFVVENFSFEDYQVLGQMMNDNFNQLLDDIIASDYAVIDALFTFMSVQNSGYMDVIAENDDSFSLNFAIATEIPAGEYYVIVRGFSPNESGNYSFTLDVNGVNVYQEDAYLESGEHDMYRFTLTETSLVETYTQSNLDTYGLIVPAESVDSNDELPSAQEAGFDLYREVTALLNPMLQDMTVEEYQASLNAVMTQALAQVMVEGMVTGEESLDDYMSIVETMQSGFNNTAANQLNIMQTIMDTMVDETYVSQFESYLDLQDENAMYAVSILGANVFLDIYQDIETDIDAIIDEVVLVMSDQEVMAEFNLTTTDINDFETNLTQYFSDLSDQANLIKDYDYTDLTEVQRTNINNFIMALSQFMIGM